VKGCNRVIINNFGTLKPCVLPKLRFEGCWKTRLLLKLIWLGVRLWLKVFFALCAGYKRNLRTICFLVVELSG